MRTVNPALALLITGALLVALAAWLRALFGIGPHDDPSDDLFD